MKKVCPTVFLVVVWKQSVVYLGGHRVMDPPPLAKKNTIGIRGIARNCLRRGFWGQKLIAKGWGFEGVEALGTWTSFCWSFGKNYKKIWAHGGGVCNPHIPPPPHKIPRYALVMKRPWNEPIFRR